MKQSVLTAVCLASLTLAACDRSMASNTKICADFRAPKAASVTTDDGAGPLDECDKRWAYSLASSGDSADTVGAAAVAACSTQLARWNQQSLNAPGGVGEGPSLLTGETTTPLGEHNTFAQSRALFYVVQARAGNCAPPLAKNGVPEGIP